MRITLSWFGTFSKTEIAPRTSRHGCLSYIYTHTHTHTHTHIPEEHIVIFLYLLCFLIENLKTLPSGAPSTTAPTRPVNGAPNSRVSIFTRVGSKLLSLLVADTCAQFQYDVVYYNTILQGLCEPSLATRDTSCRLHSHPKMICSRDRGTVQPGCGPCKRAGKGKRGEERRGNTLLNGNPCTAATEGLQVVERTKDAMNIPLIQRVDLRVCFFRVSLIRI